MQSKLNSFKYLLLICLPALVTCKKDTGPVDIHSLTVSYDINSAICYPNDSCSITYSLHVEGTDGPFNSQWLDPGTNTGMGPFTVLLKNDKSYNVKVTDQINNSVNFQFQLKKSDFDSLKYDYRDQLLTGNYSGVKHSESLTFNGTEWVLTVGPNISTNMSFEKHSIFTNFIINGFGAQGMPYRYDIYSFKFGGYHLNGYFYKDTVYITYQPALGPYWEYFKGTRN